MSKVNYTVKAIAPSGVWIRSTPSLSGRKVALFRNGDTFHASELQNGWLKHSRGWSCLTDHGRSILKITVYGSTAVAKVKVPTIVATKAIVPPKPIPEKILFSPSPPSAATNAINSSFIKSVRGIHGMPYQFMPNVDTRFSGGNFGRKFTEKIITKMPLLLLTPGKPKFMTNFSFKEKKDVLQYFASGSKDSSFIDKLVGDKREKRYYTFDFNYKDYYDYVNPMLNISARFLNIHHKTIDGKRLESYNWKNYANSSFKNYFSSAESIAFYIDAENQISESFSNSTADSLIANKANSLSDLGREMQFLLGSTAGVQFDALSAEGSSATIDSFQQFSNTYFKGGIGNLISKLGTGMISVATGGKLIFPEIWTESQFSTNYSVNVKLRTPDADIFSWYMNILVPMIHLICLVAPQQMGPNGYKSPFLVRGFYKGFFNCSMGIITSMNITKGANSKWTPDGLPTEVDINFDLKDLYKVMAITKLGTLNDYNILDNISLMDYISNMCGVNINKPDIGRALDIYKQIMINKATNPFNKIYTGAEQQMSNFLNNLYKR